MNVFGEHRRFTEGPSPQKISPHPNGVTLLLPLELIHPLLRKKNICFAQKRDAERWDTRAGKTIQSFRVKVPSPDEARIALPAIENDLAVKLRRAN